MVWIAAAAGENEEGLLKDVVFYALDSRQESILWDVKPGFVVVYDPDVTFVRQLEVQRHLSQSLKPSSSCSPRAMWFALCPDPRHANHLQDQRQLISA